MKAVLAFAFGGFPAVEATAFGDARWGLQLIAELGVGRLVRRAAATEDLAFAQATREELDGAG